MKWVERNEWMEGTKERMEGVIYLLEKVVGVDVFVMDGYGYDKKGIVVGIGFVLWTCLLFSGAMNELSCD